MGDGEGPDLAEQFARFAQACGPLYRAVCLEVAGDPELLELAGRAPLAQRRPNLLLAAVHYLLLRGMEDPLADLYPTVACVRHREIAPADPSTAAAAFRHFCLAHRDPIGALLINRATQTNEIGRCSALLPAFAALAARHGPLALLDLGTSAGLTMHFDRYAYDYGTSGRAGALDSPVRLECDLRSGHLPALDAHDPVAPRVGIDQMPLDPADEADACWLLACQWPDQLERFERQRAALELARQYHGDVQIIRGDIVDDLPAVAHAIDPGRHLCIVHTWVAAYLDETRQRALADAIEHVARHRPASWLFAELPEEVPGLPLPPAPEDRGTEHATALVLVSFDEAQPRAERLADMHPHGQWLHWFGPGSPSEA
jgi:hypothetical protein